MRTHLLVCTVVRRAVRVFYISAYSCAFLKSSACLFIIACCTAVRVCKLVRTAVCFCTVVRTAVRICTEVRVLYSSA